ncbi:hypothetical protein LSAT2_028649 [Lamellibrachia satsuma]|nr:hypothetical protein LSAT2_028649 [Lamellibrachia satsuma]
MKTSISLGCLLLLIVVGICQSSTVPSIKIRLSQSALKFGAQNAVGVAGSMLVGQRVPDEHGTARLRVGKVNYEITGTKIVAFTTPNASVTLVPDSGITFTLSGGSVSMHGHWHYRYHAIVKIQDSGSFDVSAVGIRTNISVALGMDKTGHATIHTTGCASSVFGMRVKFHGGASWLYNLFERNIKHTMERQISEKLCTNATEIIDTIVASKLQTLKMNFDIGKSLQLDYHLVKAPLVTYGYLDSFLKGEFFDKADQKEAPFLPQPLPNPSTALRMVTFWVSDYVFSTFVFVVEKYGLLNHTITNEDLKKIGKDGLLNTTCAGSKCIGRLIPELSRCCPNKSLAVKLRSSGKGQQPQFRMQPDDFSGYFSCVASFCTNATCGTETSLFDVLVNVSTSLDVYTEAHLIKAEVSSLATKMKVVHSNIGPVNLLAVEGMLKMLTNFWVIPHLNERGHQGFPLPRFERLEFLNTTIKLIKGAVRISTDLKYDPNM